MKTGLFSILCDLAVLEEARARLGDAAVKRILGTRDDRNWLASPRSRNRIAPEHRRALLEAMNLELNPDEQEQLATIAQVAEQLAGYVTGRKIPTIKSVQTEQDTAAKLDELAGLIRGLTCLATNALAPNTRAVTAATKKKKEVPAVSRPGIR